MTPADGIRVLAVVPPSAVAAPTIAALDDREGFDVVTAASAAAGLDRLSEDDVDSVVAVHALPETDGVTFLESVRADRPDLPFVLVVQDGSEAVASNAISAGVTEYVRFDSGSDQVGVLADNVETAAEAARSATETRHRQHVERLLTTVPACVVQIDADGEFVYANERAESVLGIDREAVRDRAFNDPAWDIRDLDGEPIPDAELPVRLVADSGEPVEDYHHSIEWPDGKRRVLSVNGVPLFDDDGSVEGGVFALTDVTDRHEREQELRSTTARLEAILENSPDMIDVHDAEGTLVDVNQRFCEELGYTEQELLGRKVWEIDQDIDPETAQELWDDISTGEKERVRATYRRRDGSTFPVEVHLVRLNLDDEDRFLVISRDITDRIEREESLRRQNERLEEFASVVSHDLRNPLHVAQARTELLAEECDSDHLAAIQRSHERMGALIDDLLTLARQGQTVDEFEVVPLAPLVEQCWETVATGEATLAVETDRRVEADRTRLQQLVENLVANAVEHGGPDVTVTVGDTDDGFYVADDGPGIPEDDRDAVFESGYSTAEEGTGFGLAIVRQIAAAHDWTVTATESESGGARFEFGGVSVAPR